MESAGSVPVTQDIADTIRHRLPLKDGWQAFNRIVAIMPFDFPERQKTHILRHLFASHFIVAGGQMEILQKIFGHSDTQMTNRYMHLKVDYL